MILRAVQFIIGHLTALEQILYHRLFDKQIEYFENKYNVFVWDAPGHGVSYPIAMAFSLIDKVRWLDEILEKAKMTLLVIVGQSLREYVGQAYVQLFPEKLKDFVSVDSAPLQRKFVTKTELWFLKRMEPVYRHYPWKSLLKTGTKGVSTTEFCGTVAEVVILKDCGLPTELSSGLAGMFVAYLNYDGECYYTITDNETGIVMFEYKLEPNTNVYIVLIEYIYYADIRRDGEGFQGINGNSYNLDA